MQTLTWTAYGTFAVFALLLVIAPGSDFDAVLLGVAGKLATDA